MKAQNQKESFDKSSSAGTWSVVAVSLVFLLEGLCYTSWLPRLSEIKAFLHLSDRSLGLALAGVPTGALASMPLAGFLTVKAGARKSVLACLSFLALVVLLIPVGRSMVELFLTFVLVGAGTGSTGVAMNFAAYEVESRRGTKIMSFCHGMFSAGGVLGSLWGGMASDLQMPLFGHLAVTSAGALGVLAALLGFIPTGVKRSDRKESRQFRMADVSGRLLWISCTAFAVLLIEGMLVDWSSLYMRDVLGTGGWIAGVGFASYSLCMACGRFRGDWLVNTLGEWRILAIGSSMIVVSVSLIVFTHVPAVAIVCFGLAGLGLSGLTPILFRLSAETPGLGAGVNISITSMISYCGFLVGPVLIGTLSGIVGLGLAFGVIIPIAALVMAFSTRLVRVAP